MRKHVILLVLAIALIGCSAIEEAAREGAREAAREQIESTREEATTAEAAADPVDPEPEPEPEPAREGEYGSDARLDGFYDDCADGDHDACLDLYRESPIGSGYEDFSKQHTTSTERLNAWSDNDDLADEIADEMIGNDTIVESMFELVWADTSPSDRALACEGYNTFGSQFSYESFIEGWGDMSTAPSITQFEDFFDRVC